MHRGKISKIFINQRKGRIMEKILRKGFISLLSLLMVFTTFNQLITNVAAEQEYENIALDKVVVASSAIAGNEGSNAVDGKIDTKWEVGNISTKRVLIVFSIEISEVYGSFPFATPLSRRRASDEIIGFVSYNSTT